MYGLMNAPLIYARLTWVHNRTIAVATLSATLLTTIILTFGLNVSLDKRLSDSLYSSSNVSPTGRVVIVDTERAAMRDGDSLRLPRARLADLLTRVDNAGAERILIDLSLSGTTTPDDDAALEETLARLTAKVGLTQSAVITRDEAGLSRWRRTAVLPRFAEHAELVASDLAFDSDGELRRYGLDNGELPPVWPAADWLAGVARADSSPRAIDFGIDVHRIPVIDALDVLEGRLGKDELNGRRVVIASFAASLGHVIRVPRFSELRRPEISALAAETALQGHRLHPAQAILAVFATILLSAVSTLWLARLGPVSGALAVVGFSLCAVAFAAKQQASSGLMIPTCGSLLAVLIGYFSAQIASNPAFRRVRDALESLAGRFDSRLAEALDKSGEALVTFAQDGQVLSMNVAAERIFESKSARRSTSMSDLLGAQADALFAAAQLSRPGRLEATIGQGGRGERHLDLTINAMPAEQGAWIGIASIRDVTEQRAQVDELRRMTTEDPLTRLANRLAFERALGQACARLGERPDAKPRAAVAVMVGDLDGFKSVNDTLGHQAGDTLLREVAMRLHRTAGTDAVVARLGGDEFALVLHGSNINEPSMLALAQELVAAVAQPIQIDGQRVEVGISIGVALSSAMDASSEVLVKSADEAMYRAKRARTGVVVDRRRAA